MPRRYKDAQMLSIYGDDPYRDDKDWSDCEVIFRGDDEIVVSYQEDAGFVLYKGKEVSTGYYELIATEVRGRANLRLHADGDTLEGSWVEGNESGLWKIELGDEG